MVLYKVLCIIGFCILYNNFVSSDQNETVVVTSTSNIKHIEVPTSDHPVLVWMEVRKGIFPNVTNDLVSVTNVTVGDPISLFVFYKDNSNLYDIKVTDCWAYDDENFPLSKQKLHLSGDSSNGTNKELSTWKKFRSRKFTSFLYASFVSFKFPEKDKLFLTCDIQLVGREQS
ncbi:uncharacterized protein LOC108909298 [Anoplophora glabripennis]|uniref:uncharacterized protein LOC108909298 n=1 Tax=Anoplophora glabripennis TaxID=217634 RepID=UPI0008756386|nr:uncharacterized protein LOC108909298 [Anoplophora glabripennis]